jgi:hypothetical protein
MFFFYDISKFSRAQILKGFALSYEIFRQEGSELAVFVTSEFNDGKIVTVENLMSSAATNI